MYKEDMDSGGAQPAHPGADDQPADAVDAQLLLPHPGRGARVPKNGPPKIAS